MLAAVKAELDAGFIYIFAGAVPADAQAALDMAAVHTQLARYTVNGDATTGLTFAAASGALIAKNADVWKGLIAFEGFAAADFTLTPTFFRFCKAADNGRAVGTTARLQGTVGGPASAADGRLGSDTLTRNGSNESGASIFTVRLSSFG